MKRKLSRGECVIKDSAARTSVAATGVCKAAISAPVSRMTAAAFSVALAAGLFASWAIAATPDMKSSDADSTYSTVTNVFLADAYSAVNLHHGVSGSEAQTLADTYFKVFISGCGMADGVTNKGDAWEVSTYTDYDMRPYEPIRVEKVTGRMTCKGHPTVAAMPGLNAARVILVSNPDVAPGAKLAPAAN